MGQLQSTRTPLGGIGPDTGTRPDPRLPVLLTIDVELAGMRPGIRIDELENCLKSLDCVVDGVPMGLPFILDTLSSNGLKGTFFVDPFSLSRLGEDKLDAVLERIRKGGHDIQLHLHPVWQEFGKVLRKSDTLHDYTREEQQKLIEAGLSVFHRRGIYPKAFRAGSFSANNDTYAALKNLGFTISSSYNLSALEDLCRIDATGRRNDAFPIDGLIEVPITNYLIRDIRRKAAHTPKPFQIGCTSSGVARHVLLDAKRNGYACVNIIFHNFEFIDRRQRNWLSEPLRPLMNTANAFRKLCRHLSENRHLYRTATISEQESVWSLHGAPRETASKGLTAFNRLHLPMDLPPVPDWLASANISGRIRGIMMAVVDKLRGLRELAGIGFILEHETLAANFESFFGLLPSVI